MDDEKLIEQVRRFQHLYDLSHPKYMDAIKKDHAWKEISKQLKQPVAACKQRWQGLRDAYRRALNKRKSKGIPPGCSKKKWKYEAEMTFLTPFFVERKSLHSSNIPSDEEVAGDVHTEIYIQNDNTMADQSRYDTACNDTVTTGPVALTSVPDMTAYAQINVAEANPIKAPKNKKRLNCKNVPREPNPSVLMAHMFEDRARERSHDEIDAFFLNISSTVKKFSPYLQALAKNKIFTLVSEMEIQQFVPPTFESSPTTSTWTTPNSPTYVATSETIPKTEVNADAYFT